MKTSIKTWFQALTLCAVAVFLCAPAMALQATCPPNPNCNGCPSATQSVQCTIPPEVPATGVIHTCSVPAFNSNLGNLLGVSISATLTGSDGRFRFENLDPTDPCNGNSSPTAWFVNADIALFEPSSATAWCTKLGFGACGGPIPAVAKFDGVIDFGVPGGGDCPAASCQAGSGYTAICSTPAPVDCAAICITDPTRLNFFKSAGPGGTVRFDMTSLANQAESSGCGKVINSIRIKIGATVRVTYLYCTNTPPVANNDNGQTCQNIPVGLSILKNDCDPDGQIDCSSIVINPAPAHGSLGFAGCSGNSGLTGCPQTNTCPGCVVTYTPTAGYTGPDSFGYTVKDSAGCTSNSATVSLTVNAPPNAVNDNGFTTCRNTPVDIPVLGNDVAAAGSFLVCNTLTVTVPPPAAQGATSLSGCGGAGPGCAGCVVRFTPASDFVGVATYTYEITDNKGCKDTAVVTIRVCAPTAVNDGPASVCQNQCVDINVLGNDTAATGCGAINCGTIVIVTPPQHGTAVPNAGCTGNAPCTGCRVTYCATDPLFTGSDSFTYNVKDANGCVSNTATVTVTVNPSPVVLDRKVIKEIGNDGPIANIPVLDGATPGTGCTLLPATLTIVTQPLFGTATVNANGTITYDPTNGGFPGEDTFCFRVTNSCGCFDEGCVEVNEPGDCIDRHRRNCASLLLFPEYQNTPGRLTVHTITYGCCEDNAPGVWVEMVFIRGDDCSEQNRTIFLTPCDTFTFLTSTQAASGTQGYMYAFAKSAAAPAAPGTASQPIVFNRLIGNLMVVDGMAALNYSMNAVAFKGLGADGSVNDEDNDGVRDLDGVNEYEEAPDKILIPRFLGQDPGATGFNSQLILIALSGGTAFSFNGGTEVLFTVFDDNENNFSATYRFFCWAKPRLKDISNVFLQTNLHNVFFPIDDPNEILGMTTREAGWFTVDGVRASSPQENIVDPAIYAVLIERRGTYAVAELPFELCTQINGDLLPETLFGDPRPNFPNGQFGDNQ